MQPLRIHLRLPVPIRTVQPLAGGRRPDVQRPEVQNPGIRAAASGCRRDIEIEKTRADMAHRYSANGDSSATYIGHSVPVGNA